MNKFKNLLKILAAAAAMAPGGLTGQTTPVLFSMQGLTGQNANYSILIQPDKSYATPLWWGTNLVPVGDFTLQPIGGQVITNLVPWGYTMTVEGWPRGIHVVVPVSTNTLNVVSLINTNQFSPLNVFSGTTYITNIYSGVVYISYPTNVYIVTYVTNVYFTSGGANYVPGSNILLTTNVGTGQITISQGNNGTSLTNLQASNIAPNSGPLAVASFSTATMTSQNSTFAANTYLNGPTYVNNGIILNSPATLMGNVDGSGLVLMSLGAMLTNSIETGGTYTSGTFSGNGAGLTQITAVNATGTGTAMLTNNPGPVYLTNAQNTLTGTLAGNGAGITGLNAAQLTGTASVNTTGNAATATTATSAISASVATNLVFGASISNITMTASSINDTGALTANSEVISNGLTAGVVTASLAGSTNLPAYQGIIGGPFQVQPGFTYSNFVDGSYTWPWNNNNYSWVVTDPANVNVSSAYLVLTQNLTNSPYVSIWNAYQTNNVFSGFINVMNSYPNPQGGANLSNPGLRLRIKPFGNKVGILSTGGKIWFESDNSAWQMQTLTANGTMTYTWFTWPNVAQHELQFYFESANSGEGIMGIVYPKTNSLSYVPHPTLTGIVVGDSITDGANGYDGWPTWLNQLQGFLIPYGINLIPQAEGGTGYYNGGGSVGTNFLCRITNNIAPFNPQFIIWAGGFNDNSNSGVTVAQLYKYATNCYGDISNLLPGCKQLVIAPWSNGDDVGAGQWYTSMVLSNAAAYFNLPIIYPDWTNTTAWINPGNQSVFISNDNVHPNTLGSYINAESVGWFVLTNLIPAAATNGTLDPF